MTSVTFPVPKQSLTFRCGEKKKGGEKNVLYALPIDLWYCGPVLL